MRAHCFWIHTKWRSSWEFQDPFSLSLFTPTGLHYQLSSGWENAFGGVWLSLLNGSEQDAHVVATGSKFEGTADGVRGTLDSNALQLTIVERKSTTLALNPEASGEHPARHSLAACPLVL